MFPMGRTKGGLTIYMLHVASQNHYQTKTIVNGALLKIPLSFHFTGWFIGELDFSNPQSFLGSIIPYSHGPQQF